MNIDDKLFIAGHNGLAGSAFHRFLKKRGFKNIIIRNREELDLTIQYEVENFFKKVKPDYVILAAAKVGGIHANNIFPQNSFMKTWLYKLMLLNLHLKII